MVVVVVVFIIASNIFSMSPLNNVTIQTYEICTIFDLNTMLIVQIFIRFLLLLLIYSKKNGFINNKEIIIIIVMSIDGVTKSLIIQSNDIIC